MQIDWTLVRDIGLPLLTIILPIITGFVSYRRGRTSVFRERIYDKQIEGYPKLIEATYHVQNAVNSLETSDAPYSDKQIDEWREDTRKVMDACYRIIYTNAIFFPKDVMDEVFAFMAVAGKALYEVEDYDWHTIAEFQSAMFRAQDKLIDVIHGALGTENLSNELRKHLGESRVPLLSVGKNIVKDAE